VPYHLQEAVQVPAGAANLALVVTDAGGHPVSFLPSPEVTAKVQALHPAPAGFVWAGYQAAVGIPPASAGATNLHQVRATFSANNPAAVTGATWSSSDADVVSGIAVVETYHPLGVGTEGPVVACRSFGWTCTYGLIPPVLAWDFSTTAYQSVGPPPSAVAYHLQQAVQMPTDYANLALSVTDSQGTPTSYVPSSDVTAKVQALHPAAAGYVWVGYQSALAMNPGSGAGSTNAYSLHVSFSTANPAAVTGATWSSSDADVLSGMPVVETFHALGLPTQGGRGTLTILHAAGALQLSWTGPGTLQYSPFPNGPWTDSANQSNPQVLQLTPANRFFSLRQ
jgi:hypothetical protein